MPRPTSRAYVPPKNPPIRFRSPPMYPMTVLPDRYAPSWLLVIGVLSSLSVVTAVSSWSSFGSSQSVLSGVVSTLKNPPRTLYGTLDTSVMFVYIGESVGRRYDPHQINMFTLTKTSIT